MSGERKYPEDISGHPVATEERSGERGYTLFEIMVALAILGGAMFVLLNAHYQGMRLHDSTVEELTAANLMSAALGQAETEIMSGEKGDGGDFGKRFPDYSYTYDAQADTENDPGLWTITVTLKGPDGERQMTVFAYDILRGQTPAAGGMQGTFGNEMGSRTRNRTSSGSTSSKSTSGGGER